MPTPSIPTSTQPIPTPAQPNAFSFRLRIPGILHVSATLRWFARSWFSRRRSA